MRPRFLDGVLSVSLRASVLDKAKTIGQSGHTGWWFRRTSISPAASGDPRLRGGPRQ